ncbi:MAG: hypothetical protein AAGC60_18570 [Acidobacteriota bacterium]
MSRRRGLVLVALVVLAAAGHWLYHYAPRLRAAAPADDLPGRLLTDRTFDAAVWVPYPHQTLRALERRSGIDAAALKSAATLLELELPLDRLGGRGLPPASALAVAARSDGSRAAAAVRVYPMAAAFARLSGHLADNPWLRGGAVDLDGRRLVVAWHGTTWTVATPDVQVTSADPPVAAVSAETEDALAVLRSGRRLGGLPSGRLALRLDGDALELASVGATLDAVLPKPLASVSSSGGGEQAVLVAWSPEPRRALLLLPPRVAGAGEVPRMASLVEPGGRRWRLPAEGLLEATGREPVRATREAWRVVASDDEALQAADRLVPHLDAAHADYRRLGFGLWLDLASARTEIDRLAAQAEGSPLLAPRDRRRARAAADLAQALARGHRRALVAVGTGEAPPLVARLEAPVGAD